MYFQKQIAIMTHCVKIQQTKKHNVSTNPMDLGKSISLGYIRNAQKKKEKSIENNLNRNAKSVSLRFFCRKGVLKKIS